MTSDPNGLAPGLSGELSAGGHRLCQRVYYEDTDFSGAVYHARYLHFMERGRTDFLRCLGFDQGAMAAGEAAAGEAAVAFVVRRMEIDFRAPARMDDILTIETRPDAAANKAGAARLPLRQTIHAAGRLLVAATVEIAVVNGRGRPRRMPVALARALEALRAP